MDFIQIKIQKIWLRIFQMFQFGYFCVFWNDSAFDAFYFHRYRSYIAKRTEKIGVRLHEVEKWVIHIFIQKKKCIRIFRTFWIFHFFDFSIFAICNISSVSGMGVFFLIIIIIAFLGKHYFIFLWYLDQCLIV